MKTCKICNNELEKRFKVICKNCKDTNFNIVCGVCDKVSLSNAYYFLKTNGISTCKSCTNSGENNNQYGKKWSDTEKILQSNLIKSKVDDNYRQKCSTGKKDKPVLKSTIDKRNKTNQLKFANGFKKPIMNADTRERIGIGSTKKFTPEYKQKIRLLNENSGKWIKLENIEDYKFYKLLSNWKIQPINDQTIGIDKLKNNKLYDGSNKNDLVRDHMYSRRMGFNEHVFPEILRHPANCQLISHVDNLIKSKTSNDCIILLDELFNKIEKYSNEYTEHYLCVELIKKYRSGLRYTRKEYENNR